MPLSGYVTPFHHCKGTPDISVPFFLSSDDRGKMSTWAGSVIGQGRFFAGCFCPLTI